MGRAAGPPKCMKTLPRRRGAETRLDAFREHAAPASSRGAFEAAVYSRLASTTLVSRHFGSTWDSGPEGGFRGCCVGIPANVAPASNRAVALGCGSAAPASAQKEIRLSDILPCETHRIGITAGRAVREL